MKPVQITMYFWGGSKFGIIIKSKCKECEINSGILEDMKQKEFSGKPVTIEIKSWLTHIWDSLRRGGWHAPIILVNNRLFSQGVLIDRKKLAGQVEKLIKDFT
ncbi:hypothetical protein IH779_01395 [Patescibacteria group bacterium]|nr:hypothetical protein [Patescibacteria group bacterium]